ncbi:beta-phosphoglucomutase family hydrolase [Niabella terrae]
MRYKAFLFDMNGTMIDDMQYHIHAWHGILNELGAGISLETTKEHCYGKNDELLERIFPARFTPAEKQAMGMEKERQYQIHFRPHLRLLPGLDRFLQNADGQGIKMAIGSAAIMFNIDFVLDGLGVRDYFEAIVSADDVVHSKPDPETFLKCATLLGVDPGDCLVFEDAPKGVDAAGNAGMDVMVLTTMHETHEFRQSNIIGFEKDFSHMSRLLD